MKRISDRVIGLIEWESPILDMSFVDDYRKEVDALLQAQLEADIKDHKKEMLMQEGYMNASHQAEMRKLFKELKGYFLRPNATHITISRGVLKDLEDDYIKEEK